MDQVQLQGLLAEYKDGINLILFQNAQQTEIWTRVETPEGPQFQALKATNLPKAFDYRELLLSLERQPLQFGDEKFYLDTFRNQTILLSNEINSKTQRIAISLWPERKIMVAVGCRSNQVGYLEALEVLKNEHIVRVIQTRQKQVQLKLDNQVFALDMVKARSALRRKSQHQVLFYLPEQSHLVHLAQLYTIQKQFPEIHFNYCFGPELKGKLEQLLAEHYYLNLINVVECQSQELFEKLPHQCYYYIINAGTQQQSEGELIARVDSDDRIAEKLIQDLKLQIKTGLFSERQVDDYVVPLNTEHEQLLGFHGKALRYIQQVYQADPAVHQAFCLFDFSADDDKSEYARQVLSLQKRFPQCYFVTAMRGQLLSNLSREQLHQKDRSFKELNLVEGFSEEFQRYLDELSNVNQANQAAMSPNRAPFVAYLCYQKNSFPIDSEVQKSVESLLQNFVKELEKQREETQVEPEPDYDLQGDTEEAQISEDALRFRGFRFPALSLVQPVAENKGFCVCYINPATEGFERAVEQIYRIRELVLECQFFTVIKGIKTRQQLADLAKKAYFITRLSVFQYRTGFNKFMSRCEREPFSAVFFDSSGQPARLVGDALDQSSGMEISRVVNPTHFSKEVIERSIAAAYGSMGNRKSPQLFQLNKPGKGQFVYCGAVFQVGNTVSEYVKQRYCCVALLLERHVEQWPETIERLVKIQQNKTCQHLMHLVVVPENGTAGQISTVLDKYPAIRRLNVAYDNGTVGHTADLFGACAVFDAGTGELKQMETVERVESEFLQKKMEEAERNTNVFTEDAYVKVHQFEFKYHQHLTTKKQNQICVFLVLKDDAELIGNIALVNSVQKQIPEAFIVVALDATAQRFAEIQAKTPYHLNVVEFNATSDVQRENWRYIISDQGGVQQNTMLGKEQFVAEVAAKTKREFVPPRYADCTRSYSAVINGLQVPYLARFHKSFANKFALIFCDSMTEEALNVQVQCIEQQIHCCVMSPKLTEETLEKFLQEKPEHGWLNVLSYSGELYSQYYKGSDVVLIAEEQPNTMTLQEFAQEVAKQPAAQVDQHLAEEMPGFEFKLKDKNFIAQHEALFRRLRNSQQQYITVFDQNVYKNDNIWMVYVKQIQNLQNYHHVLFPSEKLVKELGGNPEDMRLPEILAHYRYLNVSRYDNKELLGFAGQTYTLNPANRKWIAVDLKLVGADNLFRILWPRAFEISQTGLQRLGFVLPFLTEKRPPNGAHKFLLSQYSERSGEDLLKASHSSSEWAVVALVDSAIEGDIPQIKRVAQDVAIASDSYQLYRGNSFQIDQVKFPKRQKLQQLFDAHGDRQASYKPGEFWLAGHRLHQLRTSYVYKEKQQVLFARLEAGDLQDALRFFELSASSYYAICVIQGVSTQAQLDEYQRKNPLSRHFNFAAFQAGMEQIPLQKLYAFNEDLRFEARHELYEFQLPAQTPEPAKLTFPLKFGQPIPGKQDEGFNPYAPTLHDANVLYAVRDRRFRSHKNPFGQQKILVLAVGAGFGDHSVLKRLNNVVQKGAYVVAASREIPVFDDEVRYHDEQLDYEARALGEGKEEEEKRALEDRVKAKKKIVGLINVYDFEWTAEEGLFLCTADEPFNCRKVTLEAVEELVGASKE